MRDALSHLLDELEILESLVVGHLSFGLALLVDDDFCGLPRERDFVG